jgi:hypothetical protein
MRWDYKIKMDLTEIRFGISGVELSDSASGEWQKIDSLHQNHK